MRESGGASMATDLREQPGAHGTSEGASRGCTKGAHRGAFRGGGEGAAAGWGGPRVATDELGKGDRGRLGRPSR